MPFSLKLNLYCTSNYHAYKINYWFVFLSQNLISNIPNLFLVLYKFSMLNPICKPYHNCFHYLSSTLPTLVCRVCVFCCCHKLFQLMYHVAVMLLFGQLTWFPCTRCACSAWYPDAHLQCSSASLQTCGSPSRPWVPSSWMTRHTAACACWWCTRVSPPYQWPTGSSFHLWLAASKNYHRINPPTHCNKLKVIWRMLTSKCQVQEWLYSN